MRAATAASGHNTLVISNALGVEKAAVGGMRQGGYSALRTALRAPDRVSGPARYSIPRRARAACPN
ncbi:hypothetical protein ACLMAJ_00025 [Nocardia sp. KC 131]|uniref:hypothetical protein n=1 Tax=Nocardia arseniciresistens TaxID=3392119 RepID=UPI00398F0EBF